ncbi:class I SAM-dependent methyltransferase [Paenibacillus sp. MZ04-78.2]|uniref:class I SAM-dependent methyltransferase n=1 Tax=Paenibacillus sp. MZ04-78.2 TaxID=2962034 RepID=UPI0020B70A83|nr:class I SAM-dependent methyltransferase [Paenibacillus sp. MZ04-78.2]MCP3776441.1 class I SAM-dependent methyltransferase [Paenibacillus sp. MZ04-78.2]
MKQNIYDNETFFEGYRHLRETESGLNDVLEQPALRGLLPALKDLSILELGCGMGHFSKYCIEHGAGRVVGTDISAKMLDTAKRLHVHEKIEYRLSAMEDLDFPAHTFDLAVSSLALHYVEPYKEVVSKVYEGGFSFIPLNIPFVRRLYKVG